MKIYKRILGVATATILCVSNTQLWVANATNYSEQLQYGNLYYSKADQNNDGIYDYIEITDCTESTASVIIPSEIDELPVTSIGDWAFTECTSLAIVEIPNSVTRIGEVAFACCGSLKNVKVPYSVTKIGKFAFQYCNNLENITIENPFCEIYDSENTIYNNINNSDVYFNGTIHGYNGSTAQQYAEKYNINFSGTDGDFSYDICKSGEYEYEIGYNSEIFIKFRPKYSGTYTFETNSCSKHHKLFKDGKYYTCSKVNDGQFYDSAMPNVEMKAGYYYILRISALTDELRSDWDNWNADDDPVRIIFSIKSKILGDANEDGEINVRDASTIARLLAEGKKDELPETADFNCDGEINVRDASLIARYLANKNS